MSQMWIDFVIFVALAALLVTFLALEYRMMREARGGWRLLAVVPGMLVFWIALGAALNPAAHRLWPVEIVIWLIPAIVAVWLVGWLYRRRHRPAGY